MMRRPTTRGARFFFLQALIFLSLLLSSGLAGRVCAQPSHADSPLFEREVFPGLSLQIGTDGSLRFFHTSLADPLLVARVPSLADPRRTRLGQQNEGPFTARVIEDTEGGRYGFSAAADDDQDGSVDEDPLDGKDNDEDGQVDEDFAAIGHDMTAVHRQEGSSSVHLESYHWTDPGLRGAVFLSAATDRSDLVAMNFFAPAGCWVETEVTGARHTATGRPVAEKHRVFVTEVSVPGSDGSSASIWMGVMILGDRPGYLALGGEGGCELDFPLDDEEVRLAVCAAPSWLQLVTTLNQAHLVEQGVTDPLSNRRTHWIAPAACPLCRHGAMPDFSYDFSHEGDLVLRMGLDTGTRFLADPDLFSLDGSLLGPPKTITWFPEQGASIQLNWGPWSLAEVRSADHIRKIPYVRFGLLEGHGQPGEVAFVFEGDRDTAARESLAVTGFWLSGKSFQVVAAPRAASVPVQDFQGAFLSDSAAPISPSEKIDDPRLLLEADRRPASLAPELLEGWPNPFRDVIQVKFRVPQTVGEAFVWSQKEDEPANLDKEAGVPWSGGLPSGSVKIYNINGQELVTLYSGSSLDGEVTVSWNGTDSFGRQVASGTYFCKLQLDEWSVTRRIVYLR